MKTLFAILIYFISGWVYAQEAPRNHATELLLNTEPTRVEQLIKYAHSKWGNDKAAVNWEVEKQAFCYIMIYARMGNDETSKEEQLIIRHEILKEVVRSESIELERVDWFNVYRSINKKLKVPLN